MDRIAIENGDLRHSINFRRIFDKVPSSQQYVYDPEGIVHYENPDADHDDPIMFPILASRAGWGEVVKTDPNKDLYITRNGIDHKIVFQRGVPELVPPVQEPLVNDHKADTYVQASLWQEA